MTALNVGTKLQNGAFTIGKVLGQGGFGITYHGSDTQLSRHVAIKEFFPLGCARHGASVQSQGAFDAASYGNAKAKFLGEARTLAQFRHAGIVHIYTFFEENDTAYLVMEFLKGQTLSQLVETRGALPEKEAVEIIEKVASATEELHKSSVLHRDIKPDNIIVCDDGRVVLIDFGLTKKVEEAVGSSTRQLSSTAAFGSDGFAPPEQYLKSGIVGTYTDVYALGATLYFLLTGKVPPSAMERLAGEELTPPEKMKQISRNVNDAVMRSMGLKGNARLQVTSHFVDAFRQQTIQPISTTSNLNNVGVGKCDVCGTSYPKSFSQCKCGAWLPWSKQALAAQYIAVAQNLPTEQGLPNTTGGLSRSVKCSNCRQVNYLRNKIYDEDSIRCWSCQNEVYLIPPKNRANYIAPPATPSVQTPPLLTTLSSKSFSEQFGKVSLGIAGYAAYSLDFVLHVNIDDSGSGNVFLSIIPQDRRRSPQITVITQEHLTALKQLVEKAEQKIEEMQRSGQIKKINF